jgi:hypothetical protein
MSNVFYPGKGTLDERKKFVKFHSIMLFISILIGILIIYLMHIIDPKSLPGIWHGLIDYLFKHKTSWIIISLFCWNSIGFYKFNNYYYETSGPFFAHFMGGIILFIFPIVYLYNLLYIFLKNNRQHREGRRSRVRSGD